MTSLVSFFYGSILPTAVSTVHHLRKSPVKHERATVRGALVLLLRVSVSLKLSVQRRSAFATLPGRSRGTALARAPALFGSRERIIFAACPVLLRVSTILDRASTYSGRTVEIQGWSGEGDPMPLLSLANLWA